jgi:hypothetical protein
VYYVIGGYKSEDSGIFFLFPSSSSSSSSRGQETDKILFVLRKGD